jgi:hypothetical protein
MDRDQLQQLNEAHGKGGNAPARPGPGRATQVDRLLRKADGNGVREDAEGALANVATAGGARLPPALQQKFEASLGADLNGVRVHTGDTSVAAAESVGARAYTLGNDIHFNAGEYAPESREGQHLLAHEVAHTVQQSGGVSSAAQFKLDVSQPEDHHEREADRAADAMIRGERANVGVANKLSRKVMRKNKDQINDTNLRGMAEGGAYDAREASDVKEVQGLGTVGDLQSALAVIKDIDVCTGTVMDFPELVGMNTATKWQVQQYASSLGESQRTLSNFQGAYTSVRQDFGRLTGVAAQYLSSKGIVPGGEANNIAKATEQLQNSKLNPDRVTDDENKKGALATKMMAYEQGRKQLQTYTTTISQAESNVHIATDDMNAKLFGIQAAAAQATADDAKAKLASINKEISEIANSVMEIGVAVGTAGAGALAEGGLAGFSEATETFSGAMGRLGSAGKAAGKTLVEEGQKKLQASLESNLTDGAKGILESAIATFYSKDITALQSTIAAAGTEASLAKAAEEAASLAAVRDRLGAAMQNLLTQINGYEAQKAELRSLADQTIDMADSDGPGHDPELATAMRFLVESDTFIASADIAIDMGSEEMKADEEALKHRDVISDRTQATSMMQGKLEYRGNDNPLGDGKIFKKYVDLPQDKAMREGDDGGVAKSLEGSSGAQSVTAKRVDELKEARKTITDLRSVIQQQMQMSDPTKNTSA